MTATQRVILLAAAATLLAIGTLPNASAPAGDKEKSAKGSEKQTEKQTRKDLKAPALQAFMRKKIEASNKIFEGLAVEDFDLIVRGAKQLQGISAAADFVVSKDPLYTQHAGEFRRIAEKLEKTAGEKRLDSSALAYMDLTLSCIECHRFVRNILIAQAE